MSHQAGGVRGAYGSEALLSFVTETVSREPESFASIRAAHAGQGLPLISIGPDEGRLLHLLVKTCGARKAVEVGTLGGYSACWIASALPPDGVLHTLEYDPKHAAAARANLKAAGLSAKVSVHEGAALETLPALEAGGPYDFVFIDADKANYPGYLEWAVAHTRPGAVVVGDNAYLFGKLHQASKAAGADAAAAQAMRRFLLTLADAELFSSCAMVPTAEGLAVAVRA